MNLPDLLTYADINQLQEMAAHYQLPRTHSKHELIRSLLTHMQRPAWWRDRTAAMSREEKRFWQLVLLDSRDTFNMEELLGKGRQALDGNEGHPRSLIAQAIKSGMLFQSVSGKHRSLYQIPPDVRKHVIRALKNERMTEMVCGQPDVYRDEQTCLVQDLTHFLNYVGANGVRLTAESAIYRQDLQHILKQMSIKEEPIGKKKWRFGFGRRYHQYPDRFSLIYDYAYYREYITESGHTLSLTVPLTGKNRSDERESEQMYHFWLRLYRKPVPTLPLIVKWIYLLAQSDWVRISQLRSCLSEWLTPYYYMDKDPLFALLIKMLTHLGVIRSAPSAITMTERGKTWVRNSAGWDLSELDDRYTTPHEQFFFTNQQGISERMLNK